MGDTLWSYNDLVNAGFSSRQALAILNAIENSKPQKDLYDLLPWHQKILYKIKMFLERGKK